MTRNSLPFLPFFPLLLPTSRLWGGPCFIIHCIRLIWKHPGEMPAANKYPVSNRIEPGNLGLCRRIKRKSIAARITRAHSPAADAPGVERGYARYAPKAKTARWSAAAHARFLIIPPKSLYRRLAKADPQRMRPPESRRMANCGKKRR